MARFRGNHPAKIDDKGRLKVPSAFKQLLDAENVKQFYITSVDGNSAEIWPLSEWEKREEKLAESSTMDESVRRYLNFTSYYGHQIEVDAQSRVLLPQLLRGKAKLDKDVEATVIGMGSYLEVHNRELYEKNLAENEFRPQDRQVVAGLLKKQQD